MADKVIDFSRFTGVDAAEDVRRIDPRREQISQAARERVPDYTRRQQEREGRSEWSGGTMGGGTWAGRADSSRSR
jgi:hypothetical protein